VISFITSVDPHTKQFDTSKNYGETCIEAFTTGIEKKKDMQLVNAGYHDQKMNVWTMELMVMEEFLSSLIIQKLIYLLLEQSKMILS